jgi:AcrR family transcriptional regulator
MTEAVKPRRRYDSTRRQEEARKTRRAILAAARDSFLDVGYAKTTIATVAREASVSVETVYKAFGSKPRLAKAVFDVAIVGDDEPIPMLQREMVTRIEAETDPRRKLLLYGEHLTTAGPRAGELQLVLRDAAATDPAVAKLWDSMLEERLAGMSAFARHLFDGGYLRDDITFETARDVLWTYNSVEMYDLLVLKRGWEPDVFGRWIAEAMIAALLP